MYKPFTYLVVIDFPNYLPIYETYFLQKLFANMKPNINSFVVHPKLNNNEHLLDGALVGASS
jgi:hypothetical protein